MKFAVNPITACEYDFETCVRAFSAAGMTHMELWFDRLEKFLAGRDLAVAKDLLAQNNMLVIAGLCIGGLALEDVASNSATLKEFKERLALCGDLRCPTLLIIPEAQDQADTGLYNKAKNNLRSAATIAADYGIKLGLEFLQGTKFVATLSTAKELVRNVDHPNLALVLDLSHFWMDRSKLSDLEDLKPDELLIVHVNDMEQIQPETLTDHNRTFPGLGRGIDRALIPAIQATGYDGYWCMEIFNKAIWQQPLDQIVQQTIRGFEYLQQHYGNGKSA